MRGPRRHVRRRRLGGRRGPRRRGRPRRHRHPPRAVAQPEVLPLRRPRLLHDRGQQRRPPRRRRDRHPVLRLGPQRPLPRGRGRGLHGRVRRRPHPQPVPALQREDQVRRRARPGARARLRRRRDRPLRPAAHRRRRADRDAPGGRPRQGPVLRARRARPRSSSPTRCSRSATRPSPTYAREAARRGLLVADKPDSHDICFVADGDNAGWLREKLGDRAPNHGGDIVDHATGEVLGQPRRHLRLHHRPAQGAAARAPGPGRQAALRARHRAGLRHRHRRAARRARPSTGSPAIRPRWCGTVPAAARRAPSSCARTATSTAPWSPCTTATRSTIELLDPA